MEQALLMAAQQVPNLIALGWIVGCFLRALREQRDAGERIAITLQRTIARLSDNLERITAARKPTEKERTNARLPIPTDQD